MRELEILLSRRWVLKSEDKDLYYRIRDALGEIRKFSNEKIGCQIIDNSLMIKMEKIPVVPERFMGISDFSSKEEYLYLCGILMFLEEKDAQEQFVLSQLTEYISANFTGNISDWTVYTNRRRFVKALRYTISQGMLAVTDGTDETFMNDGDGEVLYENTGASRYFMRNFSRDIMTYSSNKDFEKNEEWSGLNEDRGIARRHRVYKRLLFAPAMYREDGSDEDFEYLKNYGRRLTDELEQLIGAHVQIHKGSAYLIAGNDCKIGTSFPGSNSLSDIILLCCTAIRSKVESGEWEIDVGDMCMVNIIQFESLIKNIKSEHGAGFSKKYRDMPDGEFLRTVLEEMEKWMFIKIDKQNNQVRICPLAGKIQGKYPESFTGGCVDEQ